MNALEAAMRALAHVPPIANFTRSPDFKPATPFQRAFLDLVAGGVASDTGMDAKDIKNPAAALRLCSESLGDIGRSTFTNESVYVVPEDANRVVLPGVSPRAFLVDLSLVADKFVPYDVVQSNGADSYALAAVVLVDDENTFDVLGYANGKWYSSPRCQVSVDAVIRRDAVVLVYSKL